MIYDIPLPRILDASGNEVRRINTPFASVNLNITPLSTATLELMEDDSIPARSYVEMFTSSGSAGIYRTRTPQVGFGNQSNTVEMEHAICEIGDYLVTEKIESEKSASAAISQLFSYYGGQKWQLGNVAANDTVMVDTDYDNILQAILAIMEQIPGYMLSFNFDTSPWTFSVVQRASAVTAEGRLSRNVQSVRIIEDDSELCTRVYAKGLGSGGGYGYIDADTITTYGVVERVASNSKMTSAQATRAANLYLEKHKHPRLTIEIDAQDLAQITGESLDELEIGRVYRLALPDYGITREETVTALQYNDVYGDPGSVAVTLSEEEETAVSYLHKTGSGGAGTRKKVEEDYAWIEDLNDRVSLVATDMEGLDARLDVTASQIRAEVSDSNNALSSSITQTASQIRAEVSDSNNSLSSAITQTASQIRAEVNDTANGLNSSITQTASQIRSEVSDSVSGLHSQITQTASSIRSEVASSISSAYHSIIEQTDSHIRSEVGSAVSGIYTSVIEQTGSYIRSEISAAASSITTSVIEQTGSYIRTEIANAASELSGSVIEQTESYIRFIVSDRSRVIAQWENPATIPGEEIHEGDVWVKTNGITTWNEFGELAWEDGATFNWEDYLGNRTLIYHNGAWVETASEIQQELNRQGIELNQEQIKLARADAEGNKAQLQITASMIRSEVKNTRDGLSSLIEQTASQIRTEVTNSVNGLSSSITQTASQIRAEVNNSVSGLQSSITQTASQIRSEVNNTANGLRSSITQNANQIELKVSKNGVISSINQSAEAVTIRASKINLSGYVTASELSAVDASISNLTSGVTQAGYIRTASFRAGSITFGSYSLRRGYVTVDGTPFQVVMWG